MNDLTGTIKGIILLDEKTYERLLAAENSMRLGIYFLMACFLIAAIPTFISATIDNVQPFTEERAAVFQEEFLQRFEMFTQFMPAESEEFQLFTEQFRENFAFGTSMAVAIETLPRPLPYAVGGFFRSLGGWLSSPFTHLASWMSYAIWVLLFAKISGGRGGVNRFLGLTALYAVPNLLSFLGFIPFLGAVFRLVGVIWGWVVYVKAVQVSQEFTSGKAILVAILPTVAWIVLIFFFTLLMGMSIAGLTSGAQ
jgi:hypothetical protein